MIFAATSPETQTNVWTELFNMLSLSGFPTRTEYVETLAQMGALQSLVLLAVGVVYLLCGWKAFKVVVVVNAAIMGAAFGAFVGGLIDGPSIRIVTTLAGALLLGVVAVPLMKYAVALMGGLAGSFIGYGLWTYIATLAGSANPAQYGWAGALIGLIALGLLAFVIFQETIILFTAIEGSLLIVTGGLGLITKIAAVREGIAPHLSGNVHLLPILILVPALIGIAFQQTEFSKKNKKPKPAAA